MGGSSSSSSSSSSQTNQTDERIAADGSIVADDTASVTVNYQDLSREALETLVGFGSDQLDFGRDQLRFQEEQLEEFLSGNRRAIDFGGEALGLAREASDDALEFGDRALGFGLDSLGFVRAAGDEALSFARQSQRDSFGLVELALERAFDATDGAGSTIARNGFKWMLVAGVSAIAVQNADKIARIFK